MPEVEQDPIAWWWNPNVDPKTLGTFLDNNKGRLVSLDAFLVGGKLRLAAVWVSNTGNENQAWWWNPNVDAQTLGTMLDNNKGRLVSLRPYVVGEVLRLAAVWVSNTGSHNQAWWWNPNVDPQTLGTMLDNNKGRLVSLNSYVLGGQRRYAAVWVSNTGTHNKAWWWNPNVDGKTLGTMLANNTGRLVSLDPFMQGNELRYAAVWIHNAGADAKAWFWYHGVDGHFLGQKFDLLCSYPAELKNYVAGGKRRLASVLYAYPSDPNPAHAKLLSVSGTAKLKSLANNIAPMDQTDGVTLELKNPQASAVTVTQAEMMICEAGGWVDYKVPIFGAGNIFAGKSSSVAAGADYKASGDYGSGLSTTHCVVRLRANMGSQKQYSHVRIPIKRTGYQAPLDFSAQEPVFIGGWTRPAEIVPMWIGKQTKWLTVGGQIVNTTGQGLRVGGYHLYLEIDGKPYIDQDLPLTFRRMNAKNALVAVPTQDGVPVLADFLSYFVHGFEVGSVPNSFGSGRLVQVLNYKYGDQCGAAVLDSPVAMAQTVTVKSPLSGAWFYGNSPNHTGFDAHAWPGQRFSVDLTRLGANGKTHESDDPAEMMKNTNFYAYTQPVLAAADGTVIRAHDSEEENFGSTANPNTDINYIQIEHGPGKISGYYHLRTGKNLVKVGDPVKAGDQIAEVGNAGGSSEPHLHFGYVTLDETGRGRLRPVRYAGLLSMDGSQVLVAPGTAEYTTGARGVIGGVSPKRRITYEGPSVCSPSPAAKRDPGP
jgi:hypothetical protein